MPPDGMSSVFCSTAAAIGAIEAIDVRPHRTCIADCAAPATVSLGR
jgi:hypothetical protein